MSTYTSEPGTLLAGRYRLVDQTSVGTGWAFWKATDEPLARSVTVLTFASGFPRITQAIAAAHAGGLAHLRLNPACLHWTRGSGVKITGLGIDAVLAGVTPATAEN